MDELAKKLPEAVKAVQGGKVGILDAQLGGTAGKYTGLVKDEKETNGISNGRKGGEEVGPGETAG